MVWIQKFNELRKTVQIDKSNWGNALDYMHLFIYKSNSLYIDGKLLIYIHQKETNKFMYIPFVLSIKNTPSRILFGVN